VVLVCLEILGI